SHALAIVISSSFSFLAPPLTSSLFFFHATATPEIYTLSLHDALPISPVLVLCGATQRHVLWLLPQMLSANWQPCWGFLQRRCGRSEEHTSELQSRENLVCRLLLEKKKKKKTVNQGWSL